MEGFQAQSLANYTTYINSLIRLSSFSLFLTEDLLSESDILA